MIRIKFNKAFRFRIKFICSKSNRHCTVGNKIGLSYRFSFIHRREKKISYISFHIIAELIILHKGQIPGAYIIHSSTASSKIIGSARIICAGKTGLKIFGTQFLYKTSCFSSYFTVHLLLTLSQIIEEIIFSISIGYHQKIS